MGDITELLQLKDDKEVLVPDGKWIAIEGGGTYKDYEYIIVMNHLGQRCGYVAIPPEHPYSQTLEEAREFMGSTHYKHYKQYDYDKLDIDVHGGLTFMSPEHDLKDLLPASSKEMWIGFDCGHYGDMCDIKMFRKYFGEKEYEEKESFFSAMNHSDMGLKQTIKDYSYVEKQCHHIIDQLIRIMA